LILAGIKGVHQALLTYLGTRTHIWLIGGFKKNARIV